MELLEDRTAPAIFGVTTFADTLAVNLITGEDAFGNISLRSALMAANATPGADVINLPGGLYSLQREGANEDAALSGDLDISDDVSIFGIDTTPAVIDGNALDRVFEILPSSKVVINNVTIQNGYTIGEGGGIKNAGDLTLNLVRLLNNHAQGEAGITGTFGDASGGSVNGFGGAIYNSGLLTIDSSTIANNTATGGDGGDGGVGSSDGGAGGGGGFGAGGGLFNDGGSIWITNSTFSGNRAIGGDGGTGAPGFESDDGGAGGGGVGGDGGVPLSNTLDGSDGGYGGGGGGGAPGINETGGAGGNGGFGGGGGGGAGFDGDGNSGMGGVAGYGGGAGGEGGIGFSSPGPSGGGGGGLGAGGAIYNRSGSTTIVNSTISGNRATGGQGGGSLGTDSATGGEGGNGEGGGVFAEFGFISLTNVTIADNQAEGGAGGHYNLPRGGSAVAESGTASGGGVKNFSATLNIGNTIIAGNAAQSDPDTSGTLTSQGNNLIQDPSGAFFTGNTAGNITGLAPLLGSLANNGGPTDTHALLDGSPAVDRGNFELAPAIDQRGFPRDVFPDIGASEFVEFTGSDGNPVIITPLELFIGVGDNLNTTISFIDDDSSAWLVFVDYGDGAYEYFESESTSFVLNHAYSAEGNFDLIVQVYDGSENAGTSTTAVYVLADTPVNAVTGQTTGGSGTATIPNAITATITQNPPRPGSSIILVAVLPNDGSGATTGTSSGTRLTLATFDVRVINALPTDIVTITFRVTSPMGLAPTLEYIDPVTNNRVLVSGSIHSPGVTIRRLNFATFEFTVVIDNTSNPTTAQLFGTVFTFSVPRAPAPNSIPNLNTLFAQASGQNTVALNSNNLLTGGVPTTGFAGGLQSQFTASSTTALTANPGGGGGRPPEEEEEEEEGGLEAGEMTTDPQRQGGTQTQANGSAPTGEPEVPDEQEESEPREPPQANSDCIDQVFAETEPNENDCSSDDDQNQIDNLIARYAIENELAELAPMESTVNPALAFAPEEYSSSSDVALSAALVAAICVERLHRDNHRRHGDYW